MPICRVDVLCGTYSKTAHCTLLCKACACNAIEGITIFSLSLFCLKNPCMTCALCRSLNICLTLYTIFTTVSTFLRQTAELKRIICLHNLCGMFANCPCISVKTKLAVSGTFLSICVMLARFAICTAVKTQCSTCLFLCMSESMQFVLGQNLFW